MDSTDKVAAAKAAGAGLFGGALWFGLSLDQWVLVATLVYFLLQIGLLLPKYWALLRGKVNGN